MKKRERLRKSLGFDNACGTRQILAFSPTVEDTAKKLKTNESKEGDESETDSSEFSEDGQGVIYMNLKHEKVEKKRESKEDELQPREVMIVLAITLCTLYRFDQKIEHPFNEEPLVNVLMGLKKKDRLPPLKKLSFDFICFLEGRKALN